MKLYLDDDSVSGRLVILLRQAGHDVQLPSEAGTSGKTDPVHLRHAIHDGRICLTHNYGDFEDLHELLKEAQGHHPGIWVVRREMTESVISREWALCVRSKGCLPRVRPSPTNISS